MANAASLVRTVDKLLTRFAPPFATISKRIVTQTGGDSLTGQGVTTHNVDTVLIPQPVYERGMRRDVGGADAEIVTTNTNGTKVVQSYEMTVSVNSISLAEIENPDLLFVFTDPSGAQEIYRLEDFEPIGMQATPVAWMLYVTQMGR